MKSVIFSGLLVLGLNVSAQEQVIDQRQENQEQRIEQGAQSGELTTAEKNHLERQQNRIERAENRAMKDGQVSGKEARRLTKMQNKASRDIYRAKHNKRK